jgi:hypothetical protein
MHTVTCKRPTCAYKLFGNTYVHVPTFGQQKVEGERERGRERERAREREREREREKIGGERGRGGWVHKEVETSYCRWFGV